MTDVAPSRFDRDELIGISPKPMPDAFFDRVWKPLAEFLMRQVKGQTSREIMFQVPSFVRIHPPSTPMKLSSWCLLLAALFGCSKSEPAMTVTPAEKLPPVDTRPPQYVGKDFKFSQGWWFTPATDEPGYDRDRRFTLVMHDLKDRSLADAAIRFTISDTPRDLTEFVDELAGEESLKYRAKRDGVVTKWGKYEGQGVVLRGQDSRKARVNIKVYAFTSSNRTVGVVELMPEGHCYGESMFDGIRDTFEFTTPK